MTPRIPGVRKRTASAWPGRRTLHAAIALLALAMASTTARRVDVPAAEHTAAHAIVDAPWLRPRGEHADADRAAELRRLPLLPPPSTEAGCMSLLTAQYGTDLEMLAARVR